MLRMRSTLSALAVLASSAIFAADDRPDVGPNLIVQAAADEIRTAAGTEIAFIGAGLLKENLSKDDLGSMLQYPTDEVVVLNLKGAQIRQALERAASLAPDRNPSFLQLSGVEVVFRKSGAPNARIVSVNVGGTALDDGRTYSVAMPNLLAKGGLGYFRIWEQNKVERRLNKSMEDLLKGKRAADGTPRWVAQG